MNATESVPLAEEREGVMGFIFHFLTSVKLLLYCFSIKLFVY